jgi:hypothetical protein
MPSLTTLPPIANFTAQDAKNAVTQTLSSDFTVNHKMLEGKDFWQNGELFPGARSSDSATDRALRQNAKKTFIADDILSECMANYVNGLLGHEASVTLEPIEPIDEANETAVEAQQKDIELKMRAISMWWDSKAFWRKVRITIARSRFAALRERPLIGRGDLRVWVPTNGLERVLPAPGRRAGRRFPSALSLDDALERIEVDDVEPDTAAVYTDPKTREKAAIIITGDANTLSERIELWTVEGRGDAAITRVRVLTNTPTTSTGRQQRVAPEATELTLPLRGRLPLIEAEGDIAITKPVRDMVGVLNLIATVLPRTVEFAGFKQRYLTNVEPPGMWLPYPPSDSPALAKEELNGRAYYKHRVGWQLGADMTAELIGVRRFDPDTKLEQFAEPGVKIEEPTDPEYVTKAHERWSAVIYKRMRQGHFATQDAAQLSGVAYQQHRQQFEDDLKNGKGSAEALIRETLYTVLAYAALMSTDAADLLNTYRIVVNLHPHAGPITPEESTAIIEQKAARVISRETAMTRLSVEDTVAEATLIDDDPEQVADLATKVAAAVKAWIDAGTSAYAAARLAGLDEDNARLFETGLNDEERKAEAERRRIAAGQAARAREQGTPPPNAEPQPNVQPPQLAA